MDQPSGIITLLTDFGLRDPFVGLVKAVLVSRFRAVTVIDLTHEIAPQDVSEGAFWLSRSFAYLPAGTVHLCVVDPGVGTERLPVVVRAGGHLFVGPDNGLLSEAIERAGDFEARQIDERRFTLPRLSRTFHGRDLFAPVAAALASSEVAFDDVGPPVESLVRDVWRRPARDGGVVTGTVRTVDRYGNLLTDIDASNLPDDPSRCHVELGATRLRMVGTYGEAAAGEAIALVNSFDVVEIAVCSGSAAGALRAGRGAPVRLIL